MLSCGPEPNPCDTQVDSFFVYSTYRQHKYGGNGVHHYMGVRTDTFYNGRISICDTSKYCIDLTIPPTDYDSLFYLELFPNKCFWKPAK